jgi:RNA polymerase sigma-70 factor (ECF subfamily)
VFGDGYDDVSQTLERSEAACRQLVTRARHRVADGRPRLPVDPVAHRRLLERFLKATTDGDVDGLRSLLTDDAVLVSDGGAKARAARHPIRGADRVARLVHKLATKWTTDVVTVVAVNGEPGFIVEHGGTVYLAGTIEVRGDRIAALRWMRNPDKLPR